MAKHIDYTKLGGFPLEQDTLKFNQENVELVIQMFYEHLLIDSSGKYIITGGNVNGSSISEGWVIVDGELLRLLAGTGSYIEVKELKTAVNYEDSSTNDNYFHRWAEPTTVSAGNIVFTDFQRLSKHKVITSADCTLLANRTYKYQLEKHVKILELDPTGNATAGFILNQILPFDDIPEGYQLVVKCGSGSGLTYLTKNSEPSNLQFNRNEFNQGGDPVIMPYFGLNNFIGSSAASYGDGAGYAPNLKVTFIWSGVQQNWIEISRSSNTSI